jgi:hypothetical protein
MPGLGALSGSHSGAVLIHLAVASLLALGIITARRHLRAVTQSLEIVERLAAWLRHRSPAQLAPTAPTVPLVPFLRRFGMHLARRPPPSFSRT